MLKKYFFSKIKKMGGVKPILIKLVLNLAFLLALTIAIFALAYYQIKIYNDNIYVLKKNYSKANYKKTIHLADKYIAKDILTEEDKYLYLLFRGSALFKLEQYEQALDDFNQLVDHSEGFDQLQDKSNNTSFDAYPLYMRVKTSQQLPNLDTIMICQDLSNAILIKDIEQLNKQDSLKKVNRPLFEVNYQELLEMRIKYCKDLNPYYHMQ